MVRSVALIGWLGLVLLPGCRGPVGTVRPVLWHGGPPPISEPGDRFTVRVVELDERGAAKDPSQLESVHQAALRADDIFLFVHGWRRDALTQLQCEQWVDPAIPCCIGKKGDVFTFFLTIKNQVKDKQVSLRLEADEDAPNYRRIPNGFEVLEMTPIQRTPLRVGETVVVKIVIRLNTDQWQEIKVHTLTHSGQRIDHVCSDYLSFNDPEAKQGANTTHK